MNLESFLEEERARAEEALGRAVLWILPLLPEPCRGPAAHGVRAGGKRLRPILCRAAFLACLDSAFFDAAFVPSRFNRRVDARLRFADGRLRLDLRDDDNSRFALSRVSSDAWPFSGGGSFTPARRAFESPIAIACSVERAPCFPSRTCSMRRGSRRFTEAWLARMVIPLLTTFPIGIRLPVGP